MVARFHYDDAIYERLLADKLPPSERTDVTQHVETCERCQAKLETLAEAGIDWQDVRRYLDRSGLSKATSDEADHKNGNVEFLTPSQMPHSLGRFGRYEIMEVLGRGGMGIVMRGYDPALDRHSAIKVLAPELAASAAARGRFSREAKSAAAVVHEHVVPIQTVDQENGLPYLVMPVLEGKSLEQRVRQQGILTATETLRIGRQIALGLAAAHAQGLVHRDVKPANILLHNGVERVVITDFGLARAIDDASLTQSGTIVGTPQYMSPEQAKGEHVDARGDLFSLGSVLYFMLSGHSPFRAETTMGVLHRIVNDTPRPPRQTNAEVPPWLEQIITRLLAKDPADRYATAAEVAELLGKWLAHLQDPTGEPRPSEPPEEPQAATGGGRSRVTKIALGLLGGAAALLAAIFVVLETGEGTLTIESDQADIAVRITQGETVQRRLKVTPGENVVRLAAGRYVVEIEGEHDGLTVENDRVMLVRGGKEVVRIVRRVKENQDVESDELSRLSRELSKEEILALERKIVSSRERLAGEVNLGVHREVYWEEEDAPPQSPRKGWGNRLIQKEARYTHNRRMNVYFQSDDNLRVDVAESGDWDAKFVPKFLMRKGRVLLLDEDAHRKAAADKDFEWERPGEIVDPRWLGLVDASTANWRLLDLRTHLLNPQRKNLRAKESGSGENTVIQVRFEYSDPKKTEHAKVEYAISPDQGGLPTYFQVERQLKDGRREVSRLDVEVRRWVGDIWYPTQVEYTLNRDGRLLVSESIFVSKAHFHDNLDMEFLPWKVWDKGAAGVPDGKLNDHATDRESFETYMTELEARRGQEFPLAARKGWWSRWLPLLLKELEATDNPQRQMSIAIAALGMANALEEFQTSESLLRTLVKLSRSDEEAARWQAELDGLAERAGASPNAADTASHRSQGAVGSLEGYWTATSEIGEGPWQVEDEFSSIRLGVHGYNFGMEHVDAQQKVRHQAWGKVMQGEQDSEGKSGTIEIDFHEGYPGKSLKISFQLEEDQLTIEVLSSDPPDLFGKDEKRTWTFQRGIKVPDLLEEGKFGYAGRSVDTENFSAFAAREENVFAIYSRQNKTWDRYRFAEGLKVQEVVDDLFRFEEFGEMRRDSYLGFTLSGRPVDELVAVDTQGKFQTYTLDTPIEEELVVFMFGDGLLYYAANEHVYAFSGITGTWDALSVPGLPSVKKGDGTIKTPINNYGGRPGIVVTLPEQVAIFAAKSGKWERISHDQAKEDPRFEDYNYDLKLFEPDYADPPPESQGATDTRTLEEAVQAFSDTHAEHPIGKDQPPLTEDELVASILWAGRDASMPRPESEDVDRLQQMVVDRSLPSDWRFVIETQFDGVEGERFRGWEIRLFRHGAGGDEFSHRVRRRLLYAIDESGKPLALPQRGEAEPDATPLAAAIAAFNGRHRIVDGRPQPPLTEGEVVAAILHWKTRRDEVPLMNREFETFQRIAKTRQLPAGMELELISEFEYVDGSRFFIWSVRIRAPQSANKGWTFAYEIRKQFVRWASSPDHEIQWGPVAKNGLQVGVRFQPDGGPYPVGTKVRPHFFYRSTSDRKEGVAFPRVMPRAYYDRIIAVDDKGEAIPLDHDLELGGPVGWIEMPFGFGAEHEIDGLPIVLGDAERDEAETVIKAQVGQTVHVRFVLPNYADKSAPPLETGEVVFTLSAPGTTLPKLLVR